MMKVIGVAKLHEYIQESKKFPFFIKIFSPLFRRISAAKSDEILYLKVINNFLVWQKSLMLFVSLCENLVTKIMVWVGYIQSQIYMVVGYVMILKTFCTLAHPDTFTIYHVLAINNIFVYP